MPGRGADTTLHDVVVCADIEFEEQLTAPRVPLLDLRGTQAVAGHSRQVLEDLTGHRARRMGYAGRGVGAVFALWFVLLALGGLGLIPVAGIPLARLVHPEPQPLAEPPSATRLHRPGALPGRAARATVSAQAVLPPRSGGRTPTLARHAKPARTAAPDRLRPPAATAPIAPRATEAAPVTVRDAIETPRSSQEAPAPTTSEQPAAESSGAVTGETAPSPDSSPMTAPGSGSSSAPGSSGAAPGSGQSTGSSGIAPGSDTSTGASGSAPGSGTSTGASGTAPGSGKATGASGVSPGSGHATGRGNGNDRAAADA